MVTDKQYNHLLKLHAAGKSIAIAAMKSNMCEKTARKYLKEKHPPGQLKCERYWRTRQDPFEAIWPEVVQLLERESKLEAKTIFEHLHELYPGRFEEGQLRTFQRKVKEWRIEHGPKKEVFFMQEHKPGRLAQSDFTCMNSVGIKIGGQSFEHLLYHLTLTYSNWESAYICFTENFQALSEGLLKGFKELGGVPEIHQTDNLGAAVKIGSKELNGKYLALLKHLGLKPQKTNPYSPHENGDIEQRHNRLKNTVSQALMLRESHNFETLEDYEYFLTETFSKTNAPRQRKLAEEKECLRPLPDTDWLLYETLDVRVKKTSTIRVLRNTYSVSSRLIGQILNVRVYSRYLELWQGQKRVDTLPRLQGREMARIDYRHVIHSLVRKPGAFANYRHRAQFFPTTSFRIVYELMPTDKAYLEILEQAAYEGEERVENILKNLLKNDLEVSLEQVKKGLTQELPTVTTTSVARVDLQKYDSLYQEWRVS